MSQQHDAFRSELLHCENIVANACQSAGLTNSDAPGGSRIRSTHPIRVLL